MCWLIAGAPRAVATPGDTAREAHIVGEHVVDHHGRYLARLREGLAFVWGDRLLRSIVAMVC
jgi:hypothetical protein